MRVVKQQPCSFLDVTFLSHLIHSVLLFHSSMFHEVAVSLPFSLHIFSMPMCSNMAFLPSVASPLLNYVSVIGHSCVEHTALPSQSEGIYFKHPWAERQNSRWLKRDRRKSVECEHGLNVSKWCDLGFCGRKRTENTSAIAKGRMEREESWARGWAQSTWSIYLPRDRWIIG